MTDLGTVALVGTAALVAAGHSALGADHYVPFAALARSRGWSLRRTLFIAGLCASGHVGGSVLLGVAVLGLGWSLDAATWFEAWRGELAASCLIAFGAAYAAWGLVQAHRHRAGAGQDHHHAPAGDSLTAWSLFIIFALGPCEPLVPLMAAPMIQDDWPQVGLVVMVFGAVTIATMLAMTALLYEGLRAKPAVWLDRYVHTAAGVAILLSGLAVAFLGV